MQVRFTRRGFGAAVVAAVAGTAVGSCSRGSGGGGALGGGGGSKLVVATNESPWLDAYKKLVAKYEEQKGVKVELRTFPYSELRTQFVNDIQAGKHTYDVYQLDEPWAPEFFANKWVQPLTDIDAGYTQDPAIVSYDHLTQWDAQAQVSSASGEYVGIPLNGNVQILDYRADIYDQLGVQPPKSWDDVVSIGKKVQGQKLAKYGYMLRTQGETSGGASVTYDFLALMYAFGANWFVEPGTDWTPNLSSPQGVKATTMLRELAKLGPKETTTIGQSQVIGAMQAGDSAQAQIVAAAAPQLLDEADSNIADKVGYAPLPAGDAGVGAASGVFSLTVPSGLGKDRSKAAFDFITWVGSQQAQILFTEAGGIPTRDDVIDKADVDDSKKAYLRAIQETMPNIKSHVRYTFGAEMLPITEKYLSQIAAGSLSPAEGTSKIDQELAGVIKKAGLPMKGTS